MAAQRLNYAASMFGSAAYVHLDFEDGTAPVKQGFRAGDVIQFVYGNSLSRPVRVSIFREPGHTALPPVDIAAGQPETTRAAPNQFNMIRDAEGSWAFDPQWSWGMSLLA